MFKFSRKILDKKLKFQLKLTKIDKKRELFLFLRGYLTENSSFNGPKIESLVLLGFMRYFHGFIKLLGKKS